MASRTRYFSNIYFWILILGVFIPFPAAFGGMTERVSILSDGAQTNGPSSGTSDLSTDGRFVSFASSATNLALGKESVQDIFVHDRKTGITEWVSVTSDGTDKYSGDTDHCYQGALSADGRYVAFATGKRLVKDDLSDKRDVFVHDRQTGVTERVSVSSDGTGGNSDSTFSSISADGRFVAFSSRASNLVPNDTNAELTDVFVHDRQTGNTERIVANNPTRSLYIARISANGRFIVFFSVADNLVPNDTNNASDFFVYDRQSGITERVSVASNGTQGNQGSSNNYVDISADGRFVTFQSYATNLVTNDTNNESDIFVHDRETRLTEIVSVASDGIQGNSNSYLPSISADGRIVVFSSFADNLVPNDTNEVLDVFVHDRRLPIYREFSFSAIGDQTYDEPFNVTLTSSESSFTGRVYLSLSPSGTVTPSYIDLVDGKGSTSLRLSHYGPAQLIAKYGEFSERSEWFEVISTEPLPTASISGLVLGVDKQPDPGATVTLYDTFYEREMGAVDVGSDGSFAFNELPAGNYKLQATAGGLTSEWRKTSVTGNQVTVELRLRSKKPPVILIPGIMGSTLVSAPEGSFYPELSATKADRHSLRIHDVKYKDKFDSGWDALQSYLETNYEVIIAPWDWRETIEVASWDYLKPAIEAAKDSTGYDQVSIVAHSMGGLITRKYIQSGAYRYDIKMFAMVGTPNYGSPLTYYMVEGGDPELADNESGLGLEDHIASNYVSFYCETTNRLYQTMNHGEVTHKYFLEIPCADREVDRETIRDFYERHVPSAKQLMPDYNIALKVDGNYATDLNPTLKELNDIDNNYNLKHRYTSADGTDPYLKVRTQWFVSINEYDTIWTIKAEENVGGTVYPLGEPTGSPFRRSGDGTVPATDRSGNSLLNGTLAELGNITVSIHLVGKHAEMPGNLKEEIKAFLDQGYGFTSVADLRLATPMATDALERITLPIPTLSVFVKGRTQPYLITPTGDAIGVNPVTGTLEKDIPNSDVSLISNASSITLENPTAGLYTVQIKGLFPDELNHIRIGYHDGEQFYERELRVRYGDGVKTFQFEIDSAATDEKLKVVPVITGPSNVRVIDRLGKARLCWNASIDATVTGYRLYGKTEELAVFSLLGQVEDTLLCFNTGHPIYIEGVNSLWSYFVVAINANNEESSISQVISNDIQTVAAFSVDRSTGEAPLKVQFTDESLGFPTAWEWDFDNNGITDSTQQSPIFTYKEPGSYTVELEASGPYGEDSTTKLNFVEVKKRKPICIPFRASDGDKMPICF